MNCSYIILGYRKLIICSLGIICITFTSDPETMKYITIIVGLYCGVNIFKSLSDEQQNKNREGG